LAELSIQQPNEYRILFLENGAFDKAKRLIIPNNIALCLMPPYSLELNLVKNYGVLKKKNYK
jgi:hypothetical protein